jgi:hypothetical protein
MTGSFPSLKGDGPQLLEHLTTTPPEAMQVTPSLFPEQWRTYMNIILTLTIVTVTNERPIVPRADKVTTCTEPACGQQILNCSYQDNALIEPEAPSLVPFRMVIGTPEIAQYVWSRRTQ